MVPLADEARAMIEIFGAEMQERQAAAGGLLRSSLGKAPRPGAAASPWCSSFYGGAPSTERHPADCDFRARPSRQRRF